MFSSVNFLYVFQIEYKMQMILQGSFFSKNKQKNLAHFLKTTLSVELEMLLTLTEKADYGHKLEDSSR